MTHKKINWIGLVGLSAFVLGATVYATAQSAPKTHELKLTPENVTFGNIDGNSKPVLRVASGDFITAETLGDNVTGYLRFAGIPESEIPDSLKKLAAYGKEHNLSGTPQTGPIYVEGAEPGDTLEIRFLKFDFLHPYGWTQFRPGRGTLPDEFPYFKVKILHYDITARTVEFVPGITLKLNPFWGVVQVAPPLQPPGRAVIAMSPGPFGGNMDNKELVAGSTLYLPVQVPGALLSFSDSHALQGDGEIAISASETSLRGTVQVIVHKGGKRLLWPRAESPTHFMTMGLGNDLNEATRLAVRDMLDFLVTEKGMTREDAYMLCTLAVDLRITEFVDDPHGVRAMIPKAIFEKAVAIKKSGGEITATSLGK
jgi:acetamidase/formamidase